VTLINYLKTRDKRSPIIIIGKEMMKSIQRNWNALKKKIVARPKSASNIPPKICHLNVRQVKIKRISHGNEFGIL
jgi:hypothetical protein